MLQVITFNDTLGIQRVMHSNVVSPRFVNVVFQILGFAIQKSLAEQLGVRFSVIMLYIIDILYLGIFEIAKKKKIIFLML
jgi:hypothetical protein